MDTGFMVLENTQARIEQAAEDAAMSILPQGAADWLNGWQTTLAAWNDAADRLFGRLVESFCSMLGIQLPDPPAATTPAPPAAATTPAPAPPTPPPAAAAAAAGVPATDGQTAEAPSGPAPVPPAPIAPRLPFGALS